jgi:hypothetical protein
MPDRHLLKRAAGVATPVFGHRPRANHLAVLPIALGEVGIRELSGNNDGMRVESYLAAVGLKKGQPWCAAFVSWVYHQAGYLQPRTGWSPALFPPNRMQKVPKPGLLFGIYFPELKRIGHCGFVQHMKSDWLDTIEGNTNVAGSREGDGVYRKRRHVRTIKAYADWRGKGDE